MKTKAEFTPIDFNSWPRRELFYYFSKMAPTGYSLTAELDVSHLLQCVKAAGYKFFPAYIWLVTKNLAAQSEFMLAEKDGVLGAYNILTPLYAAFHEDTKTFSFLWTEYDTDFALFHAAYMEDKAKYGGNHSLLAKTGQLPPENAYTVSAVPWVEFTHFAVHSYENKPYYFPSVEAGRIHEKGGKSVMPISLTCHHAATDGIHVDRFLKTMQADMHNFEIYL